MKARHTRHSSAWLIALTLLTAAPVWANQPAAPSVPPSVTTAPIDAAPSAAVVTRLVWDRVGSPLHGLT